MSTVNLTLEDILQLPSKKRAKIALRIIESLDAEPVENTEAAWAVEVRGRVEALRAGTAVTRPASEVFAKARQMLSSK